MLCNRTKNVWTIQYKLCSINPEDSFFLRSLSPSLNLPLVLNAFILFFNILPLFPLDLYNPDKNIKGRVPALFLHVVRGWFLNGWRKNLTSRLPCIRSFRHHFENSAALSIATKAPAAYCLRLSNRKRQCHSYPSPTWKSPLNIVLKVQTVFAGNFIFLPNICPANVLVIKDFTSFSSVSEALVRRF